MSTDVSAEVAAGHTQRIDIIINGRHRQVAAKKLTFDEVVALAFDAAPAGPDVFFTVTFQRGSGQKPEGTLVQGETLRLHEGMIIHVSATTRS